MSEASPWYLLPAIIYTEKISHETYFGCCVTWRPTCSLECLPHLIHVAQAKVDYFQAAVEIEQQVLWFQISVTDAQLMDVVDAGHQLLEVTRGLTLFEPLVLHDQLEELAS